jgi:hypothetical protein
LKLLIRLKRKCGTETDEKFVHQIDGRNIRRTLEIDMGIGDALPEDYE